MKLKIAQYKNNNIIKIQHEKYSTLYKWFNDKHGINKVYKMFQYNNFKYYYLNVNALLKSYFCTSLYLSKTSF